VKKSHLQTILQVYVPNACPSYQIMIESVEKLSPDLNESTDEKMDVATGYVSSTTFSSILLPEVEVFIFTTILTTMLREHLDIDAAYSSNFLIDRIKAFNRRSMDILSSKAFFYYSLAHERINRLENIRISLLALYRTTCIRHDNIGQAVLLNLILRNYLHYNLIEQAHTFSLRTSFPENSSNNQFCRFLYYMGRIQAIQLNYSEAYQRLMLASRKVPQETATDFTIIVHKLAIIVQLLMGEIPEKRIFNQPELRSHLLPYLALTQAVRDGDLQEFNQVVTNYDNKFQEDKNLSLVHRLGHNVLKTGLKKLSVSYSRISLADVASKLHLLSASSAEYVCAKAIR
jgi:26S proteasome regulatory subunit N3